MKEVISSGGIVYKKEGGNIKILFILDAYNNWTFPKGKIEDKETKIGAAVREVSEETGIEIKNLRIKEYLGDVNYKYDEAGDEIDKTVHYYLIKLIDPKVEIKHQVEEGIQEIKWVDLSEMVKTSSYNDTKDVVTKAQEYFKNNLKA